MTDSTVGQNPENPSEGSRQVSNPGRSLGIIGMILSIIGCTALIGLVLSIVALIKSKKRGMGNKFAWVGIVVGGLWILGVIIGVAVSVSGDDTDDGVSTQTRSEADPMPENKAGADSKDRKTGKGDGSSKPTKPIESDVRSDVDFTQIAETCNDVAGEDYATPALSGNGIFVTTVRGEGEEFADSLFAVECVMEGTGFEAETDRIFKEMDDAMESDGFDGVRSVGGSVERDGLRLDYEGKAGANLDVVIVLVE